MKMKKQLKIIGLTLLILIGLTGMFATIAAVVVYVMQYDLGEVAFLVIGLLMVVFVCYNLARAINY